MRRKSGYKKTGYIDPAVMRDIEVSRKNLPPGKGPNWSNAYPDLGARGTKLQAEGRARSQSLRPGSWNNYGPVSYTIPPEEFIPPRPPISSQPGSSTSSQPGFSTNPVDENGIPMVRTSAGWVKNPKFYTSDGKVFGFEGTPVSGQGNLPFGGNIDPNISLKSKQDSKEQELRQKVLAATGRGKTKFVYELADYLWRKNKDMKYYYLTLEEFNVPIPPMYNPDYKNSISPIDR